MLFFTQLSIVFSTRSTLLALEYSRRCVLLHNHKVTVARKEFEQRLKQGVCKLSNSCWSSVPDLVRKPTLFLSAKTLGTIKQTVLFSWPWIFPRVRTVIFANRVSTNDTTHSLPRNFDFCFVNLDDVLMVFSTESEYLAHLEFIVQRILGHNSFLNFGNSKLLQWQVKFLGHFMTADGVQPDTDKVLTMATLGNLRRSLGIVNYCHRFLPNSIPPIFT